jgi:hypothetical protein
LGADEEIGEALGIPEGLLTGLSRDSLRHSDLTVEYLEAGIDLIASALEHDSDAPETHPFLGWLSQGAVIKAMQGRTYRGSLGSIRDRWEPHSLYLRDLITWLRFRRPERSSPARASSMIAGQLKMGIQPSQIIRAIANENAEGLFKNPLTRLQFLLIAVIGSPSPRHRQMASSLYEEIDEKWLPVIRGFLERYSLSLRPGVSEQDLVEILAAVGEGLAVHELAGPSAGEDRERRMSLLGTTTLVF